MAILVNGIGYGPVQAPQDAMLLGGLVGETNNILPYGGRMALTLVDANTVRAADGVLVTSEGKRIQNAIGTYDDFTIPTGTAGVTAYYIIGYHLYVDSNNAEQVEVFTQTVASSSATISQGALIDGDSDVYVSRAMIKQDGTTLSILTDYIGIYSGAGSGSGSVTPSGTMTVFETTWKGLNVSFSIYDNSFVFVVVHGTASSQIATKSAWVTVQDMSNYFQMPRDVEGYAVINSLQRCRYRIGTDNIFKIGHGINVAGGGNENIASGYYVSFNFVFPLE